MQTTNKFLIVQQKINEFLSSSMTSFTIIPTFILLCESDFQSLTITFKMIKNRRRREHISFTKNFAQNLEKTIKRNPIENFVSDASISSQGLATHPENRKKAKEVASTKFIGWPEPFCWFIYTCCCRWPSANFQVVERKKKKKNFEMGSVWHVLVATTLANVKVQVRKKENLRWDKVLLIFIWSAHIHPFEIGYSCLSMILIFLETRFRMDQ